MAGYGYHSWGSVIEETSYGGATAGTARYYEIISESMKAEIDVKPRKSLRGPSVRKTLQANRVIGGDIVMDMLFQGLGLFIKHGMGGYSFTADTPVAGANTHVFTLANDLPTGLAVQICKGNIPAANSYFYSGVKVNTLEFMFTPEEIVQMTAGLIARTETVDASGTPTYPSDLPVLWHFSGKLTLAGTASLDFDSGRILVDNNLRRRFLMSNRTSNPDRGGVRSITGEATVEFDSVALYDKYIGATTGALALTYTSDSFVTGATPYSLAFSMPKIQLTGTSPVVEGDGPILVNYPFMALHSGSTDDALKITVVNAEATLVTP